MTRLGLLILATALAGCLSPGVSDASRVWELPKPGPAGPPVKVFLPSELRTPRVIATGDTGAWVARDLDRWASPLPSALGRLIAAELPADAGIRSALVEFRTLRVDARGGLSLVADYRLDLRRGADSSAFTLSGNLTHDVAEHAGEGERRRILAAYAGAARAVGTHLAGSLRGETNGEVAKPAPGVTVPGK
jgi:hypothetical protein